MIIAKDVIDRHDSLVDKLTALRISNIPIGKQIVNLMGVHDKKEEKEININTEVVLYRYCEDLSLIIVVLPTRVQFWSLFDGYKIIAPILIYTYIECNIKDINIINYNNKIFKFVVIIDNSNAEFNVDCYNIEIISIHLNNITDLYIKPIECKVNKTCESSQYR